MDMIPPLIAVLLVLGVLLVVVKPFRVWRKVVSSGVEMEFEIILGMRLRGVDPRAVVMPWIRAAKEGIDLPVAHLEAHYLAGANVGKVVDAVISAEKAGIELPLERAAVIDLAGRDVLEAVAMSLEPRVVETAPVTAATADGGEATIQARVKVLGNLERMVGGAGEATILARVEESMAAFIGSCGHPREVSETLDRISEDILQKGLDAGTSFEILGVEPVIVDV